MSETRVVHVNDHIPDAYYIGRAMPRQRLTASFYANPFKIGDRVFGTDSRLDRADVTHAYKLRLRDWPEFWARLPELRGKALACWCRHDGEPITEDNACHGDVLVALLSEFTDDELREMAKGARE